MRRNRVRAAWSTLTTAALNAGMAASITLSSTEAIVFALVEQGLIKPEQWRIAARLSNLYTSIESGDEPISDEVASDFAVAAKNLQSSLLDVAETIQRERRKNSRREDDGDSENQS